MADLTGEAARGALRLDFDRRLMLQFRGSAITSDGGLLAYRELDDALSLTDTGADALADARTGKNGRHLLVGLLRQSVFGRLAGYEDVNDADRLCRDPAMRWVVGDRAIARCAASASQMGRFETKWLIRPKNLAALADLPGQSRQLYEDAGAAQGGGALVTDQPAGKADEDWRRVVSHGRYVIFQMAGVALSHPMSKEIPSLIARLRAPPAPA